MTIQYALTRTEIVRSFLRSLLRSPRFLGIITIYSIGLGLFSLALRGAFSRSITQYDILIALAWMLGAFLFMPVGLFLRAKTAERTLTISPDGISTEIGTLKGRIPWSAVKVVTDTGPHVLVFRTNGNAFFIPARAFTQPAQKAEFMQLVERWRNTPTA